MTAAKRCITSINMCNRERKKPANLGVVFGVTSMKSDSFEVETTIQIDRGDDVSERNVHYLCHELAALDTYCKVGTIPSTAVICCCSNVSAGFSITVVAAGVDAWAVVFGLALLLPAVEVDAPGVEREKACGGYCCWVTGA